MSAHTAPRPFPVADTRQRVIGLLASCAPAWTKLLALVVFAVLGGLGVVVQHIAKRPEAGDIGAVALFAIAIACVWGLWISRVLLLHVDAQLSRMPALARDVPTALGLAWGISVMLPALLLGLLGADTGFAVATLTAAAMVGLVGAMLPAGVYLALCFAPLLLAAAHTVLEKWLGPDWLQWQPGFDPAYLPWIAALLVLVACWRWRAIVRAAGLPARSPFSRPMITTPLGSGLSQGGDMNQWHAYLPDWVWPAGQVGRDGPSRPVKAMRCVLGTPFAPLSGRQIVIQSGFALLLLVFFLLQPADSAKASSTGLVGGLCGGAGVLVYLYGWRLELMWQRRAGELAELALLPGWGDAADTRRSLLRAVAWSPSLACAAMVLLGLGVANRMDLGAAATGLLALALLGMALMTALACLRPLAGQSMSQGWMLLLVGPGMILAMLTLVVIVSGNAADAGLAVALAWLLLYAVLGANLLRSWRRMQARPHPFVQQ